MFLFTYLDILIETNRIHCLSLPDNKKLSSRYINMYGKGMRKCVTIFNHCPIIFAHNKQINHYFKLLKLTFMFYKFITMHHSFHI